MPQFETWLDKFFDTFFHLPTLFILALLAIAAVWWFYDIGFDVGQGFVRLTSNRGNLGLYWLNGCCDLNLY